MAAPRGASDPDAPSGPDGGYGRRRRAPAFPKSSEKQALLLRRSAPQSSFEWNVALAAAGFKPYMWVSGDGETAADLRRRLRSGGFLAEGRPLHVALFGKEPQHALVSRAPLGAVPSGSGDEASLWLGETLGYLYPARLHSWEAPGWWAVWLAQPRPAKQAGLRLWAERLPVAFDAGRLSRRLGALDRAVAAIAPGSQALVNLRAAELGAKGSYREKLS